MVKWLHFIPANNQYDLNWCGNEGWNKDLLSAQVTLDIHIFILLLVPFLLHLPSLYQLNGDALIFLTFFFQMSEIKNELDTLPIRAMLAAAFITYLSAAPEDRRRHCLETWMAQSGLQSILILTAYAISHTKVHTLLLTKCFYIQHVVHQWVC